MNTNLISKWIRGTAVTLAAAGMMVPASSVQAGEPVGQHSQNEKPSKVRVLKNATALDVQLKNGAFQGRVVDHAGKAVEGAAVEVRQGKSVVAKTVTQADGKFAAANMKGGMYTVSVGQTSGNYRMWAEGTAPEGTYDRGLIVVGENGTRGQTMGYVWDEVTGTWVLVVVSAAALGTAIWAIEEARDNNSTTVIVTP